MRLNTIKYLLLLVSLLISIVANAYDFEVGGIYYNKDGNCAIVTSGNSEYSGDVSIPSTVNYGGKEYSVTSIGERSFYQCSGLTSVTISNSVTSIGGYAFVDCTGLTSVTIGNSVTSIGAGAFWKCSSLTSVTIPNSVTSIGDNAFYYCTGLTSVTISNSVTSIGNSAFVGCSSLTSVTIPNSVTSIESWAFYNCSGLTSIKVESGNTTYDSRNDCNAIIETASNKLVTGCKNTVIPNSVTSIGEDAFVGCSGLTSVTIPNSVTSIGNSAFRGCTGLTSVTIPNSVTSIESWAFAYCSNLKSVISEIEIPFTIDSSVFDYYTETNGQLTVPKGKKSVYQSTGGWKEFSNIVEVISSYTLTIQSSSGGYVSYNGANISATTKTFTIDEGSSVTFTITPYTGYKLSKLTVNGTDVTTSVSNNQYTISNITANTSVVATFEKIVTGIDVNATNFPDENFRTYIFEMVEGADDAILTDEEIAKVTDIDCSAPSEDLKIYSLKGIEFFSALKRLVCADNRLTSLDVSKNQALTSLYCSNNQLTSLDISKNPVLTSLACHNNQLTSLDVSNTALTILDCGLNQLTSLDVSKNTALTELDCSYNQLATLDVSNNTALTSFDCSSNKLTSLDVSTNTALTSLSCYSNQLTSLDLRKNTALKNLNCYGNQLTSLDVSKNTALTDLYCPFNQLTTLDVSNNTKLTFLGCDNNQLTTLDVSKNTALNHLVCSYNHLLYLNLEGGKISEAKSSITPQMATLTAKNVSEGIAIPVPTDFDFTKVSNLKLAGANANGSITTVDGQKYLVFAQSGTAQSTIDGKELTYTYSTGNKYSVVASMDVTVTLSYTATTPTGIEVNATNFPDEAFRNWVLQNVSGASDGFLTDEEIAKVTSISCSKKGITSLEGIDFFTVLARLDCSENELENMDVSKNTALTYLVCSKNKLTSLDVITNTALTELYCHSNQLTSLDVSKNTDLRTLFCSSNQLTSLDVSKNTTLTTLNCHSNQLTSLDVSKNTVLANLYCGSNQLSILDTSKNTELKELQCQSNQLKSIDVSKNTKLTWLECYSNQLESLDVSNNTALSRLLCYSNKITSLDLSKNTDLYIFYCEDNQLLCIVFPDDKFFSDELANITPQSTTLKAYDINGGIAVPIPLEFDIAKVVNPSLEGNSVSKSIETKNGQRYWIILENGANTTSVDGKKLTYIYNLGSGYSRANSLDVTVTLSYTPTTPTGIEVNSTNFPDEAFRNWVLQNVSGASDGLLTDEEIGRITSINCSNKNISNLQGIEFFTALTTLNCSGNKLSSLDVSKNTALKKLSCQNNKLVSLDVSGCTAITEIECFSNQLTSLDVSKNTALTSLNCNSNQLASLDVSRNAALVNLYCGSNQLKSLDISNNTALKELNCQINSITNLSGLSADLALTLLICDRNQLKTLDVSRNTALTRLYCHTNQFTSLNVSRNTALTLLYCYNNQLTALDLSKNTVLESLYCDDNQLSKLDVTNNTALKELSIDNNRLTSLDVTKNTALTLLSCVNNLLTNLDVSRNTALSSYWCNNNQLTVLDVSRNTKLTRLDCYGNQLLCLNLGTNTSINDASTSISPQSAALSAQNISEGIAIPVPSDFDYSKVSNLKLAGTSVTGSVATVNGQKYLVFAKTGTAESSINGKMLTYTYNTGNSFNKASSVDVTVTLSYTATTPTGIEVNATNFPDEAFRNWILQNVSGASDGVLTDAEIAKVTSINCSSYNSYSITTLQGIEFFSALTDLRCHYNQLTVLDVSNNLALNTLICSNNQLIALDVTKNTALTELRCSSNQLTSLDVSKNTALTFLACEFNQLTSLGVSKNTALTELYCNSNQLTSLEVSQNTALEGLYCPSNKLTALDVSKNTALASLYCSSNQLTSLDVSKNTALTSLHCYSNQLTCLELSNNSRLTSASITPQTISLIAEDISEGIAIPVPSDFDLAKVTNLKLNGTSVSGKVATVSEQKYLVFAQPDTPQSTIDGKQLTYDYDTDNSFSQAVFMSVKVQLSYTFMTYSLSIQSGAGGSVSYGGTTITNKTQSFTIAEGSSVTIEMTPSNGYKLASLVVNGTDVTSGVRDNQYTISNITTNTTVVVTYKAIPQTISVDGINYEVKSATDYTLNVGKGNYSGHVVIPATVSYDGDTWTVAAVVDGAFNLSAITAITWNPNTAIGNGAFGAQTNPNLLLYVKSEAYAPTNVQNVIANGRAKKIVLTDAASGNDFNCPEAFTAEEISYTHRYGMTTGIGECRGWETIALPFTVQKVMHQTKGQLVTFKQWDQSTSAKPYWLYKLTYTGFAEADFIEANTPYVISMPNHEKYFVDYILAGNVTFSAENATVKTSENMTMPTCNDKTFRPCFAKTTQSGVYAINAVNSWVTNTGGYKEGSVFVEGLRPVLLFEAYMTTNAANAKGIIPIFETQPTAIREIPMQGEKGVRIYTLSGQLVIASDDITVEKALKHLSRGVYIVNGMKQIIK